MKLTKAQQLELKLALNTRLDTIENTIEACESHGSKQFWQTRRGIIEDLMQVMDESVEVEIK